MAILDPNTLIGIIQGKLGDLVFVRMKDGKIIVRRRPVGTPGELKGQRRIAAANAYVQKLKAQPESYAVYQTAARLKGKRACDLAKADCSHPPVINELDLSGYTGQPAEAIHIQAIDDFEVRSVRVTIAQLDGALLEDGAAVLDRTSGSWRYLTQVAVPAGQTLMVHITASDQAGNEVTKTFHHALVAAP